MTGVSRRQKRIQKDIQQIKINKPSGIHVVPHEDNMSVVHALIIGPEGTPYHNGFFYFVVTFPDEYPLYPPTVKLMTTGGGRVRFNPNLYSCGKVCLSILGTWSGPSWSAVMSLSTVLISIQSLLNEKPYHNEPGFEATNELNANNYNKMIIHETVRVAVIQMLDQNAADVQNMPQELKDIMVSHFKNNYQFYETLVESQLYLDGLAIEDPFKDQMRPKKFQYKQLLAKLKQLKQSLNIADERNQKTEQ